jgi:hypothetical protein
MTTTYGDYEVERHMGGLILRHPPTGRDTFLQPGDDAGQFEEELQDIYSRTCDLPDRRRHLAEDYIEGYLPDAYDPNLSAPVGLIDQCGTCGGGVFANVPHDCNA